MNWQTVVAFLQALLTPVIAVLTAVIAIAQYRLAKAKYRHELYERRSAVYKAAITIIARVTKRGHAGLEEDLDAFFRDTSEVTFLFKTSNARQIQAFLDEIHEKGRLLETSFTLLQSESLSDETTKKVRNEAMEIVSWFGEQFDECRRLFAKDLSLV
jgi:hypothetical protein